MKMRASPVPPPIWTLIFAMAMWGLDRYYPLLSVIPAPWNELGWYVMAIGPVAPIAAFVQFRKAGTTVNPHRPETARALVSSGVYRWTRNPMYLGLLLVLVGWAVALGRLSEMAGPPLFIVLLERVQIRPEELALRRRFGEDYDRFCHQVNRWIGRRA